MNGNKKGRLVLNFRTLDHCYISLLNYIFLNMSQPWEGARDFYQGTMTHQEYMQNAEKLYSVELNGNLMLVDDQDQIIKQAFI